MIIDWRNIAGICAFFTFALKDWGIKNETGYFKHNSDNMSPMEEI